MTYSHDTLFASLCIMEEMIDSRLKDAPTPWRPYWDQVGVNEMRDVAIELAPHADAAWKSAYARYENARTDDPDAQDPGSFDYDFIPVWLRHCVVWPETAPWDRPAARSPSILAEQLARETTVPDEEPVRLPDTKLACPSCKDTAHLYDRADVRYDPELDDWVVGDREGTIECTECDWSGQESDLVRLPRDETEENTHG